MRRALGFLPVWAVLLTWLIGSTVSLAQQSDGGFKNKAPANASGNERQSQTNLWVLEVQFKALRIVTVKLPDSKSDKPEVVMYLVYKVINRGLDGAKTESDETPVNQFDPEVIPPLFVPELTLVTNDNGVQNIYDDSLAPEAQKVIEKRERLPLKNSVEIVGPIPPATPLNAKKDQEKARYGVAMWRGVDPAADFFTIMMSGFSNGYKLVRGPVSYQSLVDRVTAGQMMFSDQIWNGKETWRAASETYNLFNPKKPGPPDPDATIWFYTITADRVTAGEEKPLVWRKTLTQRYWRPGDAVDRQEKEFREVGDPEWIFQPDDVRIPLSIKPIAGSGGKQPAVSNGNAGEAPKGEKAPDAKDPDKPDPAKESDDAPKEEDARK